jgi:diacylglycerol O-acyltransferase / wax synthase
MSLAEPVLLSGEDLAILDLECDTVAGHVCKVAVCSGPIELDALNSRIENALAGAPLLTCRLGDAGGTPAWIPDDEFDIGNHVRRAGNGTALPRSDLPATVARLFEQHLDRSRPLWTIDVVELEGGAEAVVWRIHHALADGTAAMRYARLLLWDPEPPDVAGPAKRRPDGPAADEARRRHHLAGFMRRELAESSGRSPFDGHIGRRREIAFASTGLASLHDAAKALGGATVNDAVLAVIAGALRRWIEANHGSVGAVRVKVPVSLHHEGDAAGNRDSFFCVAVPLNEPDPVRRIAAIQAETARRKAEHDAETMDSLLQSLRRCSPRLEAFAERVVRSPRRFAVNVSNVPGPRRPVSILGAPVEELHSIAEIARRHALRICVVSLGDRLQFGFCADPAIVNGLEVMAAGVGPEAEALVDAAID